MMALTFVGEWPPNLQNAGERVFAALLQAIPTGDMPTGTINLKLVDDAESKALNEMYNGNAYATDVLTFHYGEDSAAEDTTQGEIADIAISLETAERQAKEFQTSLEDEIGLLVTHGLLHVAGYDHQGEAARDTLDTLQATIMKAANLTYRGMKWTQ